MLDDHGMWNDTSTLASQPRDATERAKSTRCSTVCARHRSEDAIVRYTRDIDDNGNAGGLWQSRVISRGHEKLRTGQVPASENTPVLKPFPAPPNSYIAAGGICTTPPSRRLDSCKE